jgi:hypothetical protein
MNGAPPERSWNRSAKRKKLNLESSLGNARKLKSFSELALESK